jgi:hypothetical protein
MKTEINSAKALLLMRRIYNISPEGSITMKKEFNSPSRALGKIVKVFSTYFLNAFLVHSSFHEP